MSDYGYVRVAAATPKVVVADPAANAAAMAALTARAHGEGAQLVVFPELSLTGYTCGDLFHQIALHEATDAAFGEYLRLTAEYPLVSIVGMPLRVDGQIFNVAVVCASGEVLAVIPKTYLPGYKEFYEPRWFAPASRLVSATVVLADCQVPIGTDIIVHVLGIPGFRIGVEICEDLWMPNPPSSRHAVHGATVLVNLSASNVLVGKKDYRRSLVTQQSARCIAGYVYVSSGVHESTSDVVFDGHSIIADNGALVAESTRFAREEQLVITDIDVERLMRERELTGSFGQSVAEDRTPYRHVQCMGVPIDVANGLKRTIDPHPFVPSDLATLDERSEEVFSIQVTGLARRLRHLQQILERNPRVVIGISGGLDSTLALLVTVQTFDSLGWDRKNILAVTMPGFGTTDRTHDNAVALAKAFDVAFREIPIREAVKQHLCDIGHKSPDATAIICAHGCTICQNSQARERTQILMDLGFVVGTGDLSESALGWCTYNGDHMSMYNVNAGVPKTLVKHVVRWVAVRGMLGNKASDILCDVLDTPISPELEPLDASRKITQKTEDLIGPYELHDFFIFHMLRNGFAALKILFLAEQAFNGTYDHATIVKWLRVFYTRFFDSQFKRNAVPDGPKVGSVALSQRGDWRMPSDVTAAAWLRELDVVE